MHLLSSQHYLVLRSSSSALPGCIGNTQPKSILVMNLFSGGAGFRKADKADFGQHPVQVHGILFQVLGTYLFAAKALNLLC